MLYAQGYEVKKEEYDERDMKTEYMGAEVKDENQMDDRKRKRSRWLYSCQLLAPKVV